MSAEYLYVLINPSMPGLAKVGKSTRDPNERLAELSSATGVPTPFILVYQHPVRNCHAAERWVHGVLEEAGLRAASNREFFTAPIHEIVKLINASAEMGWDEENLNLRSEGAEAPLHEQLYALALEVEAGTDTSLPDPGKAKRLMSQASEAGSAPATMCLAMACLLGEGEDKPDYDAALRYGLRLGALGHPMGFAVAARVFARLRDSTRANLYWRKMLDLVAQPMDLSITRMATFFYVEDVVYQGQAQIASLGELASLYPSVLDYVDFYLEKVVSSVSDEEFKESVLLRTRTISVYMAVMTMPEEYLSGPGFISRIQRAARVNSPDDVASILTDLGHRGLLDVTAAV